MDNLRRLRGEPKQRQFATIDIEAKEWTKPYAVGFYDGTDYFDFIDYTFNYRAIDLSLRHVLSPKYAGYWIYAHNGGNYDFTFFLKHIISSKYFRHRYNIEITPIGSCVVRFDVHEREDGIHKPNCVDPRCRGCDVTRPAGTKRAKWTFVDSARLMPLPLNEVGEAFGIGKKVETGLSYDALALPSNSVPMKKYLEVDCRLLHTAIGKMQKTVNKLGGQLSITLPATSLDLFRRKYLHSDIPSNRHFIWCDEYGKRNKRSIHDNFCKGCLHEFIRKAYHGGRTEIFRMEFSPYIDISGALIDKGDVFDFSSHYPACMLEPMPVGDAIVMEGLTESEVYENAKRFVGMVECEVYIPDSCYIPPLPVKSEGKLIFPTGNLKGIWDTAELTLLERIGGKIVKTLRSVWFETSNIFVRFVRNLYKFRDKKSAEWNKALDWIVKILLNSLYGKFAMREERNRVLISPDSPEGLTPISFEADVWGEEIYVAPDYVIPQLSTHITALARARLWERVLMKTVELGGRLYYADTDSGTVSGVMLPSGDGLGDLKHEASIKRAVFALPKLYMYEYCEEPSKSKKKKEQSINVKAKGMGPGIRLTETDDFAGQLSEQEFFDMIKRGIPIERSRVSKLNESLRDFAREKTEFPRVITSPKQMRSVYDKRIVLDDYDTRPISLQQW